MKFQQSREERRGLALALVAKMAHLTPTPEDLAALAVEVYEVARESIAHTVEQNGGSRVELFAALGQVAHEAQEASLATTAIRRAKMNAERS